MATTTEIVPTHILSKIKITIEAETAMDVDILGTDFKKLQQEITDGNKVGRYSNVLLSIVNKICKQLNT